MTYIGDRCFDEPICDVAGCVGEVRPAASLPEASPQPGAASSIRPEKAKRGRVLIVEDEAIIAMTLESYVEDFGFEACGIAATGPEAVEMAKMLRPDLVLMDVNLMGEMDGVEAARLVRDAVGVRVVFVTAYGSGAIRDRIRSIHPGAPVVSKPVDPSSLLRAIKKAEAARLGQ